MLGRGEKILCMDCYQQLPFTGFEKERLNPVSNELFGRVPLQNACVVFYFVRNGLLQKMLHLLKYGGNRDIGIFLGELLGQNLAATGKSEANVITGSDYSNIDFIIPVPISSKKEKLRGYNQAAVIAEGMQKYIKKPILKNVLIKPSSGESQTKKDRYERYENMLEGFALCNDQNLLQTLKNKHILIVDDVITTGATIESCAKELLKIENITLSAIAVAAPE
jgi:ComF family protein